MTRELLTGNRLRRDGFRQLYFSLLMSVFFRSPTYSFLLCITKISVWVIQRLTQKD
ncbi:MAG: hypothetical protein ACK6A9_06700 [Dolichospermum sp.]